MECIFDILCAILSLVYAILSFRINVKASSAAKVAIKMRNDIHRGRAASDISHLLSVNRRIVRLLFPYAKHNEIELTYEGFNIENDAKTIQKFMSECNNIKTNHPTSSFCSFLDANYDSLNQLALKFSILPRKDRIAFLGQIKKMELKLVSDFDQQIHSNYGRS